MAYNLNEKISEGLLDSVNKEKEQVVKQEEEKKKQEERNKFLDLCRSKMNKAFLELYEQHLEEALRPKPVVLARPEVPAVEEDLEDFLSMDEED